MTPFRAALLDWYDRNKRDLPWRRTSDPYAVWVSETMLQQTTVAAVIPYFERWIERFPTVASLAGADPDECASLWSGLGYYSRCRRLHQGAKWMQDHGVPATVERWLEVPGVGPYTAAAVASISFGAPSAVVDGNVERVYARLKADERTGAALRRHAWTWAESVLASDRPGDWNQALMELGATVCRPRSPECGRCPISGHCSAFKKGMQATLPNRPDRAPSVEVRHELWIPWNDGRVGILRSDPCEWWAGLWGFPRSESEAEVAEAVGPCRLHAVGSFLHTVTRHKVRASVFVAECASQSDGLTWIGPERLPEFPMPTPQKRAWTMAQGTLSRLQGTAPEEIPVYSSINA